jgi:hypothetical protein
MGGVGVVFQCGTCRALGVAHEVVVGRDGSSVGLPCAACGAPTWLPVAAAGGVRAEARPSPVPARTLPLVAGSVLPPPTVPATAPAPVAAASPDVAADATSVGAVDLRAAAPAPAPSTSASASATAALAEGRSSPPAAGSWDEAVIARIVERWRSLGATTAAQAPLGERFERLLRDAWGDEAAHKALLKTAASAGELAFIGARYRAVLDVVRDEPRARAAQQELLTLAMLTMKGPRDLERAGAPSGKGKAYVAAVVVAALGFVGAVGYFVFRLLETFRRLGDLG